LSKNHISIYRQLLQDVGIELPSSNDISSIHHSHGMLDPQTCKTSVGHLLISLFPNDFLPEIPGFNLHLERLSTQTLKASRELPELGIPRDYFSLHVSIDNAHSGHSAIALVIMNQMAHVCKVDPTGAVAA